MPSTTETTITSARSPSSLSRKNPLEFKQRLIQLGYVEGQNIRLEVRPLRGRWRV